MFEQNLRNKEKIGNMLPGVLLLQEECNVIDYLGQFFSPHQSGREKAYEVVYYSMSEMFAIRNSSLPNKQQILSNIYRRHFIQNKEISLFKEYYSLDNLNKWSEDQFFEFLSETLHSKERPHWKVFTDEDAWSSHLGHYTVLINLSTGTLFCPFGNLPSEGTLINLPDTGLAAHIGGYNGPLHSCWWDSRLSYFENDCRLLM
tara:strand:- start:1174 stop:1779 length:606 start_codon:yes stop_codon:yes gene_type:complete